MKILQKIVFLLLISFIFSTLNAGKDDLRRLGNQQKQVALKTASLLQKGHSERYKDRHPYKPKHPIKISPQQKRLALAFSFLMLGGELANPGFIQSSNKPDRGNPVETRTTQQPTEIKIEPVETSENSTSLNGSPVNGSSVIHYKAYNIGDEAKTNGPCEQLSDGSTLCHDIQAHYTVESCHYPKESLFHSKRKRLVPCVSFDPTETSPDYIAVADSKIKSMCKSRYHSFDIQDETKAFMKKVTESNHTLETYKEDDIQITTMGISDTNWNTAYAAKITISIVNNSDRFPQLIKKIINLKRKFHVQKMPYIGIYDAPSNFPAASLAHITSGNPTKKFLLLMIQIWTLQNLSDEEISNLLSHEFEHLKQAEGHITGNNDEAEANIASVLETNNPCLAAFIRINLDQAPKHLTMPLTKENLDERLLTATPSDHEPRESAILSMYGTYNNLQKAKKLLGLS